jgi:hypothetical protein
MATTPAPQYLPQAAAPAAPSVFGRASEACKRNSGFAVALIIALVLVVAYLAAGLHGWGGLPVLRPRELRRRNGRLSRRQAGGQGAQDGLPTARWGTPK